MVAEAADAVAGVFHHHGGVDHRVFMVSAEVVPDHQSVFVAEVVEVGLGDQAEGAAQHGEVHVLLHLEPVAEVLAFQAQHAFVHAPVGALAHDLLAVAENGERAWPCGSPTPGCRRARSCVCETLPSAVSKRRKNHRGSARRSRWATRASGCGTRAPAASDLSMVTVIVCLAGTVTFLAKTTSPILPRSVPWTSRSALLRSSVFTVRSARKHPAAAGR